jgi:hypothetical protein
MLKIQGMECMVNKKLWQTRDQWRWLMAMIDGDEVLGPNPRMRDGS